MNKGKFTCPTRVQAYGTQDLAVARRAVNNGNVVGGFLRLCEDGADPIYAARLMADEILYLDKRVGKAKPHPGARCGRNYTKKRPPRDIPDKVKRYGIYPVAQSGALGNPIQYECNRKVAETKAAQLSRWGKTRMVVKLVSIRNPKKKEAK